MNNEIIQRFKQYFYDLSDANLDVIEDLYAEDVLFIDPIREIKGIKNLKKYFSNLNNNLIEGSFTFLSETADKGRSFLMWEANLKLKVPRKPIKVSGISVIFYEDRITKQLDFFDAGKLFYENIPILGYFVKLIKVKLSKH